MTANLALGGITAAVIGVYVSWIYWCQHREIAYLSDEVADAWREIYGIRKWLADEFGDYDPPADPAPTETTVIRTDTDEVHAAIDNGIRGIVEPTTRPTAVVRPVYPAPTDDLEQRIAAIRRQSAERAGRRH